jgi:hypothetical protein
MIEFERIAGFHRTRYPLMRPQDFGKLAYQSEYGPEHMVADERAAAARILEEWQAVSGAGAPCGSEPIGNGLCRFHLIGGYDPAKAAPVLAKLFVQSAAEHRGTQEGLLARLEILRRMPVEGMEAWLAAYRRQGCPPVHHSDAYRGAYGPHYRVLREVLALRLPALLVAPHA